ncbi:MAG: hypothetical protein EBQ96_02005 [Proteobacteria bacterium]|nr:hypothetical protein [Pseudomonadota bacterium]
MSAKSSAAWSLPTPIKWVFKGAGAGAVISGLVACSTVPNDGALFQPTGRVIKQATVLRVEFTTGLRELGRSHMETVPVVWNANSEPPIFGRCFYQVAGIDYATNRLVDYFVERRCHNFVTGFTPTGPYNRY